MDNFLAILLLLGIGAMCLVVAVVTVLAINEFIEGGD